MSNNVAQERHKSIFLDFSSSSAPLHILFHILIRFQTHRSRKYKHSQDQDCSESIKMFSMFANFFQTNCPVFSTTVPTAMEQKHSIMRVRAEIWANSPDSSLTTACIGQWVLSQAQNYPCSQREHSLADHFFLLSYVLYYSFLAEEAE
jgi:hypothetical protein